MTYGRLLLQFLVIPIVVLAVLIFLGRGSKRRRITQKWRWTPLVVLAALLGIAVLYTIPWDNHLIALGVWSYSPARISGVTVGLIPLEELIFFPLQTLLVGLWSLWLIPYFVAEKSDSGGVTAAANNPRADVSGVAGITGVAGRGRLIAIIAGGALWFASLAILRSGWQPGTYLGWELVWALPPLLLQVGLGGDILWEYRRLLGAILIPLVLYLCAVDIFALQESIWMISSQQSLGILLVGQFPLEELIFFSLTSVLVAFGLVLGIADASRRRLGAYRTFFAGVLGRQ